MLGSKSISLVQVTLNEQALDLEGAENSETFTETKALLPHRQVPCTWGTPITQDTVTLFRPVICQKQRVSIFRDLSRISGNQILLSALKNKKNDSIFLFAWKISHLTLLSSYVISTYVTSLTSPLGRAPQLKAAASSVRRKSPSQLHSPLLPVTSRPVRRMGTWVCRFVRRANHENITL